MRRADLTVQERRDRGTSARDRAPLSAHAPWKASSDRQDPVAILEQQDPTGSPTWCPYVTAA
jgi:hypothetical protein